MAAKPTHPDTATATTMKLAAVNGLLLLSGAVSQEPAGILDRAVFRRMPTRQRTFQVQVWAQMTRLPPYAQSKKSAGGTKNQPPARLTRRQPPNFNATWR